MPLRILVAACLLLSVPRLALGELPWQSDVYRYRAVQRELADVLRSFAWDQRLNIVIDETIGSRVISEEVEMPPQAFLDHITRKYGLIWYYDGTSLYIYRGDNLATRAFSLQFTTPSRVIETMKSLKLDSDLFPFRILEQESVILSVGPPRMLEMAEFVIQTLERRGQKTAESEVTIAVFPLKFASAADQTLALQDRTVVLPGIATILQSVVTGQQIPAKLSTLLPRNLHGLSGYGLNRFSQSQDAAPLKRNPDPSVAPPSQNPPAQPSPEPPAEAPSRTSNVLPIQPSIRADQRMNAVIVKDMPSRIDGYRRVIEALDQPTGLVEITAKIIDINKEGVFEWGLPSDVFWGNEQASQQIGVQLSPADSANLAVTLMKDQVTHFLGQIKALEQDGYARVASRPSLLTLDNVEAQIDNSETFFVRVEGDFEVELFDVSIGTTLNIVPHIIEQGDQRMIKLTVQVEDGGVLEQTVDEIPRIRSDSITTQAVLRENQSLLIGGLFREEKSETVSQIPVLGNLPGIGGLFRSTEFNTARVERLILIEPRIISNDASANVHSVPKLRRLPIDAEWNSPATPPYPQTTSPSCPAPGVDVEELEVPKPELGSKLQQLLRGQPFWGERKN